MIDRTISAIIIEDDEEAISLLEIYLQAFHEIEIIDKTTDPKRGIKLLKKKVPNIVFLDIDMPELDGLSVARIIKENDLKTEVVFTTAHTQYAYKALNLEPLDYLVKPFGPEELISVINRYKAKVKKKDLERRMDFFMRNNKVTPKIKLSTRSGVIFINPEDIMLLRSEANYCRIFLNDGSEELATINIYKVASIIDSPSLFKANRSAYLNLQYLKMVEKKTKECTLKHKDLILKERLTRSSLAFFEKLNCFPIG